MTCGIYAIVCTKTWRSYVGQSVNLETRFQEHLQLLRRSVHNNLDFQTDFNLFGENSFHYEILIRCSEIDLGVLESKFITDGINLYNKTQPSYKINLSIEEQERFWKWIKIGDSDKCWDWFGSSDKDGYGRMGFSRDGKKKMFRANRLAYFLSNPDDDVNLVIRHKCDNAKCCNPGHLCIGTNSQNSKDKLNKKDFYKLNWDIVKELRQKFISNPNIPREELGEWLFEKYNIAIDCGSLVKICLNEKWVDDNYNPPNRTLKYYVKESDLELIKSYMKSGLNNTQIMRKLNKEHNIPISVTSIHRTIKQIKGDLSSQPSTL